jgi:hypothetical protein
VSWVRALNDLFSDHFLLKNFNTLINKLHCNCSMEKFIKQHMKFLFFCSKKIYRSILFQIE